MDWKEVGKKALDVSKKATEKSIDSFQEWKNDPERIKKAEERKKTIDKKQDKKAPMFHNGVHCPKCRSMNVEFMQNNHKSFSVGKAAGGAILTGGVGTLAGFAGKKGKNQWHCKNCGNTFTSKK